MGKIEWTDDHSVGVQEIDDQHKELVKITNKLFQAIMEDRGASVLMDVLLELEEYVIYHFRYEEKLMIDYEYPALELKEHIEEHEALKAQVRDFIMTFSENEDTMDIEVFDFLRSWTDEHLAQTDAKYIDFFSDKNVK